MVERTLAECPGAAHVVGVNSGTDALALLLRAIGPRPGDEVVVPADRAPAAAAAGVSPAEVDAAVADLLDPRHTWLSQVMVTVIGRKAHP